MYMFDNSCWCDAIFAISVLNMRKQQLGPCICNLEPVSSPIKTYSSLKMRHLGQLLDTRRLTQKADKAEKRNL
eukprot:g55377.t1